MLIVKIGGGENVNWKGVCGDILELSSKHKLILVHGASAKRDEIAKKMGAPTKYITSPSGHKGVYTDKEAVEILTMAYAGLVNKSVVAKLQKEGINAVGLSGVDGRVWEGMRKTTILSLEKGKTKLVKDTYTGKVEKVNSKLIRILVDNGYLPVITQPAISFDGEIINTDNDRNIAVMVRQLAVKELVILFEAPGLLKNLHDESSLIKKVRKDELDDVMKEVEGRMKKKVLGAKEAFESGVKRIYWGDARIKNPITSALVGNGTLIS